MAPVFKLVFILAVLSPATSAADLDIEAGACSPEQELDGTSLVQVMRTASNRNERSSLLAEAKSPPQSPQPPEEAKTDAHHKKAQARTQADHKKEGHQDEDHYTKQESSAHLEVLSAKKDQRQHAGDVDLMKQAEDTGKIVQGHRTLEGSGRKKWYPSQILAGAVFGLAQLTTGVAKDAAAQAQVEAAQWLKDMWKDLSSSVEKSCEEKVKKLAANMAPADEKLVEVLIEPVCEAAQVAIGPVINQTCIALAAARAAILDVGVQAIGVALAPFSGGGSIAAAQVVNVTKEMTALLACEVSVHRRCLLGVAQVVSHMDMDMLQDKGDQFCVDLKAGMDRFYDAAAEGGPEMQQCAEETCTADDSEP